MKKFLILLLSIISWAYSAESIPSSFENDLKKMNKTFSLSYPSTFSEPLELTLEDKRYIKKFNEIQQFYLEIMNKYFTRYNRNHDVEPYVFTSNQLSEIHYDILSRHLKVLGKYEDLSYDQAEMLKRIKAQSLTFSEVFLERANRFVNKEAPQNKKGINLKPLIEKLKFSYKYSAISSRGIRVRSRMKGRVVALTFLVSLIATNILPPTFTILGFKKLAFAAAIGIQPILKQLLVSTLFKIKNNKKIIALIGSENHKKFKKFRSYLYKNKPMMKAIDLIEGDRYIKYRYRKPGVIGNLMGYFQGVKHLNFSKIQSFAKTNKEYAELVRKAEKISGKDYDRTWYFIVELYSGKKDDRFFKFINRFDKTFSEMNQHVDNIHDLQKWVHQILQINDFISFEKTLRNAPEGIPTIVYFEMLNQKILPIFSSFKEVEYESFREMVQNLYIKKFERLQSGNNTLDRQELKELANILTLEARRSQSCKSWLDKTLPKFQFLRGIVF